MALLESAHHKSVPAQQTALENISYYDVIGLKPDPARYSPDHLVVQLEFLAAVRYLRENRPEDEDLSRLERDFTVRHLLNWLPAALKRLKREDPPLFPELMEELVAFLEMAGTRTGTA